MTHPFREEFERIRGSFAENSLPCPFCGSSKTGPDVFGSECYGIRCYGCGVRTPDLTYAQRKPDDMGWVEEVLERALKTWNRRPDQSPPRSRSNRSRGSRFMARALGLAVSPEMSPDTAKELWRKLKEEAVYRPEDPRPDCDPADMETEIATWLLCKQYWDLSGMQLWTRTKLQYLKTHAETIGSPSMDHLFEKAIEDQG